MSRTDSPSLRPASRRALMLGSIALFAYFAGNQAGRSSHTHVASGVAQTESQAASERGGGGDGPSRDPAQAGAGDVTSVIARLERLTRESPDPERDLEWEAAVDSILSKLSPDALAAVHAQIDRTWNHGDFFLAIEVVRHWAAKDPAQALVAAYGKGGSKGSFFLMNGFQGWAQDQPEEALAFLNSDQVPGILANKISGMRLAVLDRLLQSDAPNLSEEFQRLDSKAAAMLTSVVTTYRDDDETRNKLIALAEASGRPEDFKAIYGKLMWSWSQDDPEGARASLDSVQIPEEARGEMESAYVFGCSKQNSQEALDWWMSRHADDPSSFTQAGWAASMWSRSNPEEAAAWMNSQPPGPQRDVITSAMAVGRMQRQDYGGAASIISNIADPDVRASAEERLALLWATADPAAAAKWKAGQAQSTDAGSK